MLTQSLKAFNMCALEKKIRMAIREYKKDIIFVSTVLATLKSEKTAYQGESFAFIGFLSMIIIPTLPPGSAVSLLFCFKLTAHHDLRQKDLHG
jgi:hypothetical protein